MKPEGIIVLETSLKSKNCKCQSDKKCQKKQAREGKNLKSFDYHEMQNFLILGSTVTSFEPVDPYYIIRLCSENNEKRSIFTF